MARKTNLHRPWVDLTDPKVLGELEERILAGEPLWKLFEDPVMPGPRQFYKALSEDSELGRLLANARRGAQEAEIDKAIEIADHSTNANHKVAKIRIATRRQRAKMLDPYKFGDKVDNSISTGDRAIRVIIENDPESGSAEESPLTKAPYGAAEDL